MYVHEGITLTKRQSARLIRTGHKNSFYLSAQNQLCTMQLLHKKVKRYNYYSKRSNYSSLKPLMPTEFSSLLSLSLESERITDSSKTLHNLKKETSKTLPWSLSLIKWCQS